MRVPNQRIDEERVTVDSLDHHLREVHGCTVSVERGEDPPDFWVTIDDERFAVEVTSIVSRAGVAYDADIKRLCGEVQQVAMVEGRATGVYALRFGERPAIPKPGSKERRDLVRRAVAFILETQGAEPARHDSPLSDDEDVELSIRKWAVEGASVERIVNEGCKWEGECEDELRALMSEAVSRKRGILDRHHPGQPPARVILAFYDAYGFAEASTAETALRQVEGHEWFHSVYWAASFANRANRLFPNEPGRHGRFLHSERTSWLVTDMATTAPGAGSAPDNR